MYAIGYGHLSHAHHSKRQHFLRVSAWTWNVEKKQTWNFDLLRVNDVIIKWKPPGSFAKTKSHFCKHPSLSLEIRAVSIKQISNVNSKTSKRKNLEGRSQAALFSILWLTPKTDTFTTWNTSNEFVCHRVVRVLYWRMSLIARIADWLWFPLENQGTWSDLTLFHLKIITKLSSPTNIVYIHI